MTFEPTFFKTAARKESHARPRAYTLVEVMVTLTMMLIMSAMLLPIMQSSRDTAKIAVCTGNMKQIYNSVIAESLGRENRIVFPDKFSWQSYTEAITEPEVMICPMESDDHFKLPDNKIEFIPPPPSVKFNALQSDNTIYVFREKESFVLPQDVEAITEPGSYGRKIGTFDSDGVITAGTLVDVYYFHFDPKTKDNEGSTEMYVLPGHSVAGFIGRNDPGDYELNDTDTLLGLEADGVVYEKHKGRRLEGGNDKNADRITLPESRGLISYDSSTANPRYSDSMRVLTTAGSASSYGMNGEIGKYLKNEKQIFLADAFEPIIDFDGEDVADNSIYPDVLAPRHFGKVNVVLLDGSVELMETSELNPDNRLWRNNR